MRKKFIIAAVPLALLLAACGPTTPVGDKTGAESVKVQVKGDDTAPDVQFKTPINVSSDTVKVMERGDGEEIKDGDQLTYRLASYDGTTGKLAEETFSKKQDQTLTYDDTLKSQAQAVFDGLKGLKKGATIAYIPKPKDGQQSGVLVLRITDVKHRPEFKDMPAGEQFGDKPTTDKITAKWGSDSFAPEVSIPTTLKPTKDGARLFGEGSGETITDNMKLTLHTALIDIPSGKVNQDGYPMANPTTQPTMDIIKKQMPVLYQAIKGRKVGQTVVYVPKTGAGQTPSAMVLTITKAEKEPEILSQDTVKKLRADGKLPTIKEGAAKTLPTISFPEGKAPEGLVVETVKEGTGPVVKATDTVQATYAGWAWDSKKKFDENFTTGKPASFSLSQVITGWTKGLAGQKVGSTVMLVVPKAWAYGDQGKGDAQGDLVFYVKITKASAASATPAAPAAPAAPAQ